MLIPAVQSSNVCFFTILIFVILDLYFGYYDWSCTHAEISNAKIGFGLGTWLKISGYTNFLFLLFPIARYWLAFCSPALLLGYMIFAAVYVFFRFIWLMIGGMMYWGYLWGSGLCSLVLSVYMWVNLIYGIFILFFLCHNQQQVYTSTYLPRSTII